MGTRIKVGWGRPVPRHYDCPMTLPGSTTGKSSSPCPRMRLTLVLLLSFTVASVIACNGLNASKTSGNTVFLNRDLSTGDLSQWTHRDFGLGTDVGGNTNGAGYLWYHSNVAGRRTAG